MALTVAGLARLATRPDAVHSRVGMAPRTPKPLGVRAGGQLLIVLHEAID